MNLTFAAAAEPRNRHRYYESPRAVPAGLASTTPPPPRPPETQRPLTMPKLIWPEQLRWQPDGKIDMKSLEIPFVLKKLLEWRHDHPDIIDITGPADPSDEKPVDEKELERWKAEAQRWDEENDVRPYRLRKWHVVEDKFPQPPHGIEGAAEHARILRKARKKLREELAAAAAAAAAAASAPGGTVDPPPFTPGGGSGDDFRLRSPSGSASSMSGRPLPPELFLGTSPGTAAYVGSPRSLGRLSTLPKIGRPFADKDSYVGVAAQPSLRSSPRGAYGGGGGRSWGIGGSGSGGGGDRGDCSGSAGSGMGLAVKAWGGGGGSAQGGMDNGSGSRGGARGSTPVAAAGGGSAEAGSTAKPSPVPRDGVTEKVAKKKKAKPEFESKTMSDEAFALYVPKWKEYDNRVDQVLHRVVFLFWPLVVVIN